MQFRPDLGHAEQHHAEESGFEKEGGEHLIGHQRSEHRSRLVREDRPVRAELVGHDQTGHDAHGEGDGENLDPVLEQIEEDLPPGRQPEPLQNREVTRESDGKGGEHDVERHREAELDPRQEESVKVRQHVDQPEWLLGTGRKRLGSSVCGTNPAPLRHHAQRPVPAPPLARPGRRSVLPRLC